MLTRFFTCWFILLTSSTFALATETFFEVVTNEENSVFGTIATLDRTQIVIDVQGTFQTIPIEKLVKIRNLAPSPYEGISPTTGTPNLVSPIPALSGRNPTERRFAEDIVRRLQASEQSVRRAFPGSVIALELKDGSRLTASSFTVSRDQGICRLLEQQDDLPIPLNDISAVRFAVRSLSEVVNPPSDWQRLAVPDAGGDRLIVGNPGSFDVYAGILSDVGAETISFAIDGEVLPVPRRRVFGLVLHGEAAPSVSVPPLATLTLWTGTRGMVSDLQLAGNELTWQTTNGVAITVPLDLVSEIDFGEQGLVYLFDFERARSEFSLPFVSDIRAEQLGLLQTFFESRTQASREVILDGVAYDRGITLHGKTLLEYHLPEPFATLRGVIGIEDQFRPHASARLQILVDSQILGTWELRGDTASQRIDLNLPQNCRLITIIVEPLQQSSGSTVLTIADAKLSE